MPHCDALAHRAVDTHHACRNRRTMKHRGITKADNPFGMTGKLLQWDALQHLHSSVATTAAHDGFHRRIPERPKQILSPFFGRARKTMPAIHRMSAHYRHISPTAQRITSPFHHLFRGCARRRNNGYRIACLQRLRHLQGLLCPTAHQAQACNQHQKEYLFSHIGTKIHIFI